MVKIGKIVNTHGIKGELKIAILTDFVDERFKKGNTIIISNQKDEVRLTVKSYRLHKNHLLVQFEGFTNINEVEKYKGYDCFCLKEDIMELEDGVYYFDLIDCEVYDEDNNYLGKITEIIETIKHEVIRVSNQGKDILIPYVDAFIIEENIDEKKIIVKLITGMQ